MKFAHYAGPIILGTALLVGCMSSKPDQSDYSGWMADYSNLSEVKTATGGTSMRWLNPAIKRGQYNAIMISPIAYYPAPPADSQVPLKVIDSLPKYLALQIGKELGNNIRIVQQPGPNVLRLRTAITGVETPVEGLQAYEIIPIALIFAGASAATGHRDHNTVVYLEAQLTDSQTGTLLAKAVRKGVGENLDNHKSEMTLNDAKPVLNDWAKDAALFIKAVIK
ncbi:MAG TPA: DUF3313 domain-containing protein [Pseudomonadales bacterium]|nr:DUF3313 domain-containing protein [Pseudomonadales bacterium]